VVDNRIRVFGVKFGKKFKKFSLRSIAVKRNRKLITENREFLYCESGVDRACL
jgi:hypothetical protein